MNNEPNLTNSLEQSPEKSFLPLTIIKMALIWLEMEAPVGAVLTVLFFDVTSCFETRS